MWLSVFDKDPVLGSEFVKGRSSRAAGIFARLIASENPEECQKQIEICSNDFVLRNYCFFKHAMIHCLVRVGNLTCMLSGRWQVGPFLGFNLTIFDQALLQWASHRVDQARHG